MASLEELYLYSLQYPQYISSFLPQHTYMPVQTTMDAGNFNREMDHPRGMESSLCSERKQRRWRTILPYLPCSRRRKRRWRVCYFDMMDLWIIHSRHMLIWTMQHFFTALNAHEKSNTVLPHRCRHHLDPCIITFLKILSPHCKTLSTLNSTASQSQTPIKWI